MILLVGTSIMVSLEKKKPGIGFGPVFDVISKNEKEGDSV